MAQQPPQYNYQPPVQQPQSNNNRTIIIIVVVIVAILLLCVCGCIALGGLSYLSDAMNSYSYY